MMTLYKTLVRPILEYCSAVWNPSAIGEIAQLEQVQRNFTRRILGCKHLDYWERLPGFAVLTEAQGALCTYPHVQNLEGTGSKRTGI